MDLSEKRLNGETVYKGIIVNVRRDNAILCNGKEVRREVVEHPGGVGIVPVEDDGTVWCVRQYRYPMEKMMLEIPAGKLDKDESPLNCAVRELSEETGLTASKMISLGACCTSPGFSTEVIHLYLATGLTRGQSHLDEDEFLNIERHKLSDLVHMVMSEEIDDAKTIIAILKANQYLQSI